jgi:hypothetical protein
MPKKIKRTKKDVSVDNKVKKKPVYEDKRNRKEFGTRLPLIEDKDDSLLPEVAEMCVLIAEGKRKSEILKQVPELSSYRYDNLIKMDSIQAHIDEVRAEMLLQNAEQLEPIMYSLVASLVRYFKRKAAKLELAEPVAEKLIDRALKYCEARVTVDKKKLISNKGGDNKERKLDEVLDKPVDSHKPIWSEEDFEDPVREDKEEE